MRSILLAMLAVPMLTTLPARAGSLGGGHGGDRSGGGGGALGHVSSGLGRASGSGPSSGSSSSSSSSSGPSRPSRSEVSTTIVIAGATVEAERMLPEEEFVTPSRSKFDFYAGAQKVHDSDGAFSIELAILDRWARVGGSVTRFFEHQPGAEALTLTIPSFTLGVRIDDSASTAVFLEGGVVGAKTQHDPKMDTSLLGVVGGVRVESWLTRRVSLVGDAQAMAFEAGVRAAAMRVGVRVGPVQASMRIFAFNVGPALYGPELGLRF